MSWDFETHEDYQKELDWVDYFVSEEVIPVDQIVKHAWDMSDPVRNALIPPLQEQVRDRGLWACYLGPNLGGPGYGQVKLALLNEILGRSHSGPIVFGCHAPDSGNSDILAHYGTPELKARYLEPLLRQEIVSAYSMTEPRGGSDPTGFATQAVLDGEEWVINGEKWFSSHTNFASFLILLAVTDPEEQRHRRLSMFVVPADTPGIEIVRNVRVYGHPEGEGTHSYIRYHDVRIPKDTSSAGAATASWSPRPGWVAAASTTPCARSASSVRPSTRCASACSRARRRASSSPASSSSRR